MKLLTTALLGAVMLAASGCACSGLQPRGPAGLPTVSAEGEKASPTPVSALPPPDCPHVPLGGFYDVWRNEQVWSRLGCAVAPAEAVTGTEAYLCNGTHSLWLREKLFFVALPGGRRSWTFVADESDLAADAPLMVEPAEREWPCFSATGRHGWLAGILSPDASDGRQARTSETAFSGAVQEFAGGWLLWNGDVCFVLFADGTRTMF